MNSLFSIGLCYEQRAVINLAINCDRDSLIHPGDRLKARYYLRIKAFFDTYDLGIEY